MTFYFPTVSLPRDMIGELTLQAQNRSPSSFLDLSQDIGRNRTRMTLEHKAWIRRLAPRGGHFAATHISTACSLQEWLDHTFCLLLSYILRPTMALGYMVAIACVRLLQSMLHVHRSPCYEVFERSQQISKHLYTQMLLCSIERDSQVLTTINASNYFSVMY